MNTRKDNKQELINFLNELQEGYYNKTTINDIIFYSLIGMYILFALAVIVFGISNF